MASSVNATIKNIMHTSITEICKAYFKSVNSKHKILPYWYFCDNKTDANACAKLVLEGIKRATTPSLAWYEKRKAALPSVGDLNVITDWSGQAVCIIQTRSVEVVPYINITQEYAAIEGEGDKSLDYWRRVHWEYYKRELGEFDLLPTKNMLVVCEIFDVVYRYSQHTTSASSS